MEHRRKEVTAMGAEIEGEVLAQVWDDHPFHEKVLAIFDNKLGEVQLPGEACSGTCLVTLPVSLNP